VAHAIERSFRGFGLGLRDRVTDEGINVLFDMTAAPCVRVCLR
jgi:hypothetical protein